MRDLCLIFGGGQRSLSTELKIRYLSTGVVPIHTKDYMYATFGED